MQSLLNISSGEDPTPKSPYDSYNETVNYREPPKVRSSRPTHQKTIGDMHGNTLKLIHFLMEENVIKADNYEELFLAYMEFAKHADKDPEEAKKASKTIIHLIRELEFVNKKKHPKLVRFIGDMLADRGESDYFTLITLERVRETGVNFEILLSNHDLEFIKIYEIWKKQVRDGIPKDQRVKFIKENTRIYQQDQARSISHIQRLLDDGELKEERLIELVEKSYKPALKILSYTLSDPDKNGNRTIVVYTHAPMLEFNLDIVQSLCKKYNIDYVMDDKGKIVIKDAVELAKIIDRINDHYMKEYIMQDKITESYDTQFAELVGTKDSQPTYYQNAENADKAFYQAYISDLKDFDSNPIITITMNRQHIYSNNFTFQNNDKIIFVNGHNNKPATVEGKNYCVDNNSFKITTYANKDEYYNPIFAASGISNTLELNYKLQPSQAEIKVEQTLSTPVDKILQNDSQYKKWKDVNDYFSYNDLKTTLISNGYDACRNELIKAYEAQRITFDTLLQLHDVVWQKHKNGTYETTLTATEIAQALPAGETNKSIFSFRKEEEFVTELRQLVKSYSSLNKDIPEYQIHLLLFMRDKQSEKSFSKGMQNEHVKKIGNIKFFQKAGEGRLPKGELRGSELIIQNIAKKYHDKLLNTPTPSNK